VTTYNLVTNPGRPDGVIDSLGLYSCENIGADHALFKPIHGSAPEGLHAIIYIDYDIDMNSGSVLAPTNPPAI
jgi:isocitrate dehydrogenase